MYKKVHLIYLKQTLHYFSHEISSFKNDTNMPFIRAPGILTLTDIIGKLTQQQQ